MGWVRRGSIGFVILIIIIAVVVVWVLKAPIMSSYLSKKLGVPVSMLGIKMRPSYTRISRFHIANPRGSKTKTAFSTKTINIDYDLKELFGDRTTIDRIDLNDVFLGIEFYNPLGTKNNWTAIGGNLSKKKSNGHPYLIRKLVISDMDVEIYGMGLSGLLGGVEKKHIDRLEFTNINSKDGFPTEQLIEAIFGRAGLQDYIKNLFSPQGVIKDAVKPLFRLFGKNNEAFSEQESLKD